MQVQFPSVRHVSGASLASSHHVVLTGQLTGRHQEATDLQCTARMYHQAMDECQRLQSENIALRQMLQNALENSPACRARSSSRGRNQLARGATSAQSVLKPHMSFLAERDITSANHRRSCSPTLSRCADLQKDTAQLCTFAILAPGCVVSCDTCHLLEVFEHASSRQNVLVVHHHQILFHLCMSLFICSISHSCSHSFIHAVTHPSIHSSIQSLSHSFTHSFFLQSFSHSVLCSLILPVATCARSHEVWQSVAAAL